MRQLALVLIQLSHALFLLSYYASQATIYEDEAVISPVAVPDHTEVISSCSTVIKNGTRAQAGHVSDVAVKSEVADGSTVPDLSVEGHVGADGCVTKCIW